MTVHLLHALPLCPGSRGKGMRSCVLKLRLILVFLFFQILLQVDEERRDPDDGTYGYRRGAVCSWNN